MIHSSLLPTHSTTFIVYKNQDDIRYLVLKKSSPSLDEFWQVLSGSVKNGETAWDASLRMIKEETALHVERLFYADAVETFYQKIEDKIVFAPTFLAFTKQLEPILLSENKYRTYEWLDYTKAIQCLVLSEQRRILEHIHTYFVCNEPNPINLIFKKN